MRRRAASAVAVLALLLAGATACTAGPGEGADASAPTTTVGPVITPSRSAPPAPVTPEPPTPITPPPAPEPSPPPAPDVPDVPETVPAALLGVDWDHVPTQQPVVALTFDAGSSDAAVSSILDTLAAQGVTGTFFITGDFARRYPAQVARIAAAGHRLGNHSDTHAHYPALSDAQIALDLAAAESSVVAAAGPVPLRPWFRFPYGDRTRADITAVNDAGYVPVRWTVDTLGWKGTSGGITADLVRQRVLAATEPGAIVLMHVGANPDDGTTLDADALPSVITALRAAGYGFVTLDAML